jgi:hypothetical protein
MTTHRPRRFARTAARNVGGVIVTGLLSMVLPLALASPANAARLKTISIADAAIVEGDTGHVDLAFKVTWTGPKGGNPVTVSYATADGSATAAGSDYTSGSGTISLPSGCRCNTITVPILGDTTSEGTETFSVNLSTAVNAVIGDGHAVGTIYDNEGDPSFVVLDASANEASGALSFSVWLTHATAVTETVDYATADGTAVAGSDYMASSGKLTFAARVTSMSATVPLLDDSTNEADETLSLNLSNASRALDDPQAIGTIVNDDAEPTISIGDATAAENDGQLAGTISLSAASGQEVDVDYATTDGTAIGGTDYTATIGTAVIAAGQTTAEVDVPLTDDALYEGDESLIVDLSTPYNATILDAEAAGTITNDEPLPAAAIGDASLPEGNTGPTAASFTVTLDRASAFTTTVDWTTADGTAAAGSDYAAANGTVTFDPGITWQLVSVNVIGDAVKEFDETFTVELANPSEATIAGASGTATIVDDDRTATAVTVKVREARTKLSTKGVLEAAQSESQVAVSLLKNKGTK